MRDPAGNIGARPRVFVSSVVEGFAGFRRAAREAIVAAGGEPVLVNEDFPSLAASSRNACLDAVDSSDYFISIVGQRGGWAAPSGKLVVEEEYERARARKLPVLVFLQDVDRDAEGSRFARQLSDYVEGVFRRTFSTPEDIRHEVERALLPLFDGTPIPNTMRHQPLDHFKNPYTVQHASMLRFVLTPERDEEVVDPVRLGSEEFRWRLYEIGHDASVRLFSYEQPKSWELDGDSLIVTQTEANGRHGEGEHVRLQVSESGELVIDANVTGRVRRGSQHQMLDSMVVALEDIERALGICFSFAATLYDEIDSFKRHQRFFYNAGLSGLEYRKLERNPQQRSSFGMSMRERGTVIAFDELRLVGRADLVAPAAEIARVITMLIRKAGD